MRRFGFCGMAEYSPLGKWHMAMWEKYLAASDRPWIPVWADPLIPAPSIPGEGKLGVIRLQTSATEAIAR